MKIPSLSLVALLVSASASTTVNAESTCSEESGVCICSGSCPLFTSSWGDPLDLGDICIAHKSGDNNVGTINTPMSDGDVMTANGIEYTYPFDACPGGDDVVATPVVPDDTTTADDAKDDGTPTDNGGADDTDIPTDDGGGAGDTTNDDGGAATTTTTDESDQAESTCSEGSGVCICSGSCPSFTSSWGTSSQIFYSSCFKIKSGMNNFSAGGSLPPSDGDVITVNDIEYTYPFDACPGSANGVGGETSPGAITVGSWLVGGVAVLAAVVGW